MCAIIQKFRTFSLNFSITIIILQKSLVAIFGVSERRTLQLHHEKFAGARFNEGTIIIMERTKDSILYNSFRINHSIITPLPLFHDASETSGFLIEDESERLVYITDTGYIHESLYDMISNANIYILESNHDPEILMTSNRPYPTKIRILSDHGHMSNEESMITLANIMGSDTKYVLHAHVSQECNLSEIIELTRKKVFNAYNVDTSNKTFVILHPYPSEVFKI